MHTADWSKFMSLDSPDEIAKALGVPSLDNLPEDKLPDFVALLSDAPEELQLQLMKTNPDLQRYALKAIAAVEDDLRATLSSIDASSQQAFSALAEIRGVVAGELNNENISDERWLYLMDMLKDNGRLAMAVDSETKELIKQQADAARVGRVVLAFMPAIKTVVQVGASILITRGRI